MVSAWTEKANKSEHQCLGERDTAPALPGTKDRNTRYLLSRCLPSPFLCTAFPHAEYVDYFYASNVKGQCHNPLTTQSFTTKSRPFTHQTARSPAISEQRHGEEASPRCSKDSRAACYSGRVGECQERGNQGWPAMCIHIQGCR